MTSSENIEETVLIFKVPEPFYPSHHDSLNNSSSSHFLFTGRGLSQDVTFMKQICHLEKAGVMTNQPKLHALLSREKLFPPNLPDILASSSIFSPKKWVPFNDPLLKAAHHWHWWMFLSPSRLVSVSCPDLKSLALSWHEDIVWKIRRWL